MGRQDNCSVDIGQISIKTRTINIAIFLHPLNHIAQCDYDVMSTHP